MSKILIVDDEDHILDLLDTFLRLEGYETLTAKTGVEAVDVAKRELPHLILLDLMLPDMDGLAVCRRLRQSIRTTYIPIIMLTARQGVGDKVEALSIGADDYITKPFNLQELLARIRTQLRHVELGLLSELTGLPGNTLIERTISQLVRNQQTKWAILYVDIDEFKAYNDVYGFVRGNELIKSLALILEETVGNYGNDLAFLGHIGGDDFVAIVGAEQVDRVCRRIIARFDEEVKHHYSPEDVARGYIDAKDRQGNPVRLPLAGVSIGVVTNKYKAVDSVGMVGKLAAEVKAKAKSVAGSTYYVDMRR
ncbi:MAG: GGDEF domain-containing response regulator [Chloroflexota bacterium]